MQENDFGEKEDKNPRCLLWNETEGVGNRVPHKLIYFKPSCSDVPDLMNQRMQGN